MVHSFSRQNETIRRYPAPNVALTRYTTMLPLRMCQRLFNWIFLSPARISKSRKVKYSHSLSVFLFSVHTIWLGPNSLSHIRWQSELTSIHEFESEDDSFQRRRNASVILPPKHLFFVSRIVFCFISFMVYIDRIEDTFAFDPFLFLQHCIVGSFPYSMSYCSPSAFCSLSFDIAVGLFFLLFSFD